jgi:hypothetical protein
MHPNHHRILEPVQALQDRGSCVLASAIIASGRASRIRHRGNHPFAEGHRPAVLSEPTQSNPIPLGWGAGLADCHVFVLRFPGIGPAERFGRNVDRRGRGNEPLLARVPDVIFPLCAVKIETWYPGPSVREMARATELGRYLWMIE